MKECFIICPLDKAGTEIRKRSDLMLKHVLSPVLKNFKYKAIRADQIPKAGLITTQIINLIIDSPLVIADLTGGNPNVFYELAIRHASGRPYIQVIEKGEKIPFDIGAVRTVEIDHTDLDNVEEAKVLIGNYIKEIHKGHLPDSPISVATGAKLLLEDEELAEKIASKLEFIPPMWDGPSYFESDIGDEIDRFTNKGTYTIEDLDRKLEKLLSLVSTLERK